jgi:hypothetical protein
VGFQAVVVPDEALLLRALEIYEQHRIHFAESYLVACAELSSVGVVASFDATSTAFPRFAGSSRPPDDFDRACSDASLCEPLFGRHSSASRCSAFSLRARGGLEVRDTSTCTAGISVSSRRAALAGAFGPC